MSRRLLLGDIHALASALPQGHLYLEDGLDGKQVMQKIDFAFWTGEPMIAVEIDSSQKNLENMAPRDRRYRESGVDVVYLLNDEIRDQGVSIMRCLPRELRCDECLKTFPARTQYVDGVDWAVEVG
ncbi:MAG: hypothetical protein ACFCBU_07525 [Cyanophyceae cyanobacterium]|mgnify:CR=1 FL=1